MFCPIRWKSAFSPAKLRKLLKEDVDADRIRVEYIDFVNRAEYTANEVRDAFIDGYQQAEKDLELTWEDMRELYIIFAEVDTEIELCKTDIKPETLGYYQEVLKRFKNLKK